MPSPIQVLPTIFNLFAGNLPANFELHLSDGSPLIAPVTLASLKDATFSGYAKQVFTPYLQTSALGGLALMTGTATFTNNDGPNAIVPTCLFLVSLGNPNALCAVVPAKGTAIDPVPNGTFTVTISFECYLLPGG